MEQPFPRLDSARLRISAGFSLTSFEQLRSTERNRLQRLDPHASWAAALVPTEPGWRRVHLVGPETAALLAAFRVPALPPASTDRRTIARLVLDGILEAEHGGKFLSGPAAHPLFFQRTAASIPRGPIQTLSLAALRYAEALGISDPLVLAQRLYLYNTRPASPRWRARLPDARAVAHFLEGSRTGRVRRAWRGGRTRATTSEAGRANWRIWDCSRARRPSPGAPTFKLYLSPELDAVGDAWRAAMDLFSTAEAPYCVKVGRELSSLLRPDKLVAYFGRHADLLAAAARLRTCLAGMASQGVPFTSDLGDDALLSWAADPAEDDEAPGPGRQGSWRGWITTRLAAALATGMAAGSPLPPSRFAIDRVALDGVDTERWIRPGWLQRQPRFDADH